MSYSVIRTEDFGTYKLYEFLGDSDSDLDTIKSDYGEGLTTGSTAWAKEDNIFYKYMVDMNKDFIKTSGD